MLATRLKHTPWGWIKEDDFETIVDGIQSVSTPSHGGIKLSRERNAQVPDYMRCKSGWYEEDCNWAIPVCVFAEEFSKAMPSLVKDDCHLKCLLTWHPDAYEKFTGKMIEPGKSFKRDEKIFRETHENDFVVISAMSSKSHTGMVECFATLGGKRMAGFHGGRTFLVPDDEYNAHNCFGFVIDTAIHKEI